MCTSNAFQRTVCKLICTSLVVLSLHTVRSHADDSDPSMFSFNGFGTLGVVHSSEGKADFVSGSLRPKGAGYSDDWSFAVDSRIAGQITANFTPQLSAVVQAIVEQKYDNSYTPQTEWANLKYKFTPDFDVRVGRTVLPIFLVSDYRKVGYVNPWVRPPVELYDLVPISNSDGVDMNYHFRVGDLSNNIKVLYGNSKNQVPADSGGGTAEAKDQWGIAYDGEYRTVTVHLAYLRAENLTIQALEPLFEAVRLFGPEGIVIADNYDPNDKPISFIGIGGTYNPGAWFLTSEWGTTRSDSVIGNRSAWYVSGGHRFGEFTPYVTFAKSTANEHSDSTSLTISALPPFLAGPAATINAALSDTLGPLPEQQTISAGVRWDFMDNFCLKLQVGHSNLGSDSKGTLVNIQPGFEPGGSFNVFSASVNFVF
jgi:hypothetical protein